jgi:hypothetical protein
MRKLNKLNYNKCQEATVYYTMEYYIKTETSYFGKVDADIDDLLLECIDEINGKLDETALSNAGVVCISYGASRKFRIRDKLTGKIVMDIPTTSKEIWVMGGNFQKEFTHEVPVEKKLKINEFHLLLENI